METEAIVLDCIDHGESDVIVTMFCLDVGRISAIAKGAKKSKRRFVNKLEISSFLHINYQQKNCGGLAFLADAELHAGFVHIRSNLDLYGIASIIREFLLIGVREGEPDKKIFRLSLWALHNLDSRQPAKTVLTLFLIRFFDYMGYRPELASCVTCKARTTTSGRYSFDYILGGIACPACAARHNHKNVHVSQGTIMMLRSAQDMPLEKLHRLKISGSILAEALTLLQNYGHQLFQRDIISWRFVGKMIARQIPPSPV